MTFDVQERYNAIVIELKGDVLGGPDGAKLIEKLHELRDQGKKNIVVDLGKVRFMNSSGLGMLIAALTTMRNAGGDLKIARATERIQSLLVVTKLITIFEHYASVEEAVASYGQVAD
ncbi:MAG: STAS domain-containing protein [Bacteroidetes bacterium]|nr:STAS domain-containing protein [Rhodothermia bacterium]MCS7154899.1 STAS domain-containing protein [Bacteroidota bacterium]MCX7906942.1 STAS domain-containing protein [Bacteroidota bacterium]MDW8137694.1 STAS domain-containing protein [Bacteroidota bacterium]MDW8285352.1 STAS domain-containing protein [Bacteroidota bacterium]